MSNTPVNNSKIIKSNNQAQALLSKLQELYHNSELLDITLVAGIDKVTTKAHRIILAASSEYFLALFRSSVNELPTENVEVQSVKGSTLKSIIDYMYTATIELSSNNVESILRTADHFEMSTLIVLCCDFMHERLDACNCLGVALLAEELSYTELYDKSLAFAYEYFEAVCSEQEFLRLDERRLNRFLSGNDLQVASQEKLFLSLLAWYKHDEENREEVICSLLLQHVRYAFLKPKFITEQRKHLSNIIACTELMWGWLDWHLSAERATSEDTKKIVLTYRHVNDFKFKAQTYNLELREWSFEDWPSLSQARTDYSMFIANEKFIISGGNINGKATNRVEYLDLKSMEWFELPPMVTQRDHHGMAEVNGDFYVVGGDIDDNTFLRSVERYDFSERRWHSVTQLPSALDWVKVAVLNGILYVAGKGRYYLECYDLATNRWFQTGSKNESSSFFGLVAFEGHLYSVGGRYDSGKRSKTVERYNPSNNTWTVIKSLKEARFWICCTVCNDRLYACGGWNENGKVAYVFEEYNPRTNEWKILAPFLDSEEFNIFSTHLSTFQVK